MPSPTSPSSRRPQHTRPPPISRRAARPASALRPPSPALARADMKRKERASRAAPAPPPDSFDLFADVSHHGSSLFELLSLPPAGLDALTPPLLHAPPLHEAAGAALHHSQTSLHEHARDHTTVLQPARAQSVSMSSPTATSPAAAAAATVTAAATAAVSSALPPAAVPFQPFAPPRAPQVDSYCTVDPDAPLSAPSLPVDFNGPLQLPYGREAPSPSAPPSAPAPASAPLPLSQPPPAPSNAPSAAPPPARVRRRKALLKGPPATEAARLRRRMALLKGPPTTVAARPDEPKELPRAPRKPGAKGGLPPARAISKPRAAPHTPPSAHAASNTTRRKARPSQTSAAPSEAPNESENSELVDDYGKLRSPLSNSMRNSAAGDNSSMIDDGANKDTHNSHTRRCRAKVNSKFQELLSILPTPPAKTGIKHKAQILDYTIRVFRDIHARKTLLEAELALSSRAQLNSWVDNVVSHASTLQEVLAPYLSLICTKGSWKYSEAWVPSPDTSSREGVTVKVEEMSGESDALTPTVLASLPNSKLRLGLAVIPSLGNTDDPDLPVKLERFRDRSRAYACKPRVDLPGRIMCTMRPEWLPSLDDQEAFQRARLIREASLTVCFGVPLFVRGHVAAVAMFFDTEQRAYDSKCVDLADNIAALLGNCFGASSYKKD